MSISRGIDNVVYSCDKMLFSKEQIAGVTWLNLTNTVLFIKIQTQMNL